MDQKTPGKLDQAEPQAGSILAYKDFIESAKRPLLKPAVWKFDRSLEALHASDRDFKRRIIALAHPDLAEESSAAQDLAIVMQLMKPGERSQLHRHSPWALHFALAGQGYTTIEGVRYDWSVGDIVFTPAWAYHEHVNTSDTEDAILYSLQNMPMLAHLNSLFREEPAGEPMKHVLRHRPGDPGSYTPPPREAEEQGKSSWRA
ncbi:gentisate 1,2-dioxygenase [Afipia carboxidovorans OM5]|uniref:Cupin type-2 domain-containing protein n=1 Tax=Afipia carboxidovorans (strain ATCC 49405 / DSM 1227 / KCTC 32145 / OM5) TaxID=504832 RepID=B6JAJ9_AFIC5|nr:cupin domain-containing protein [Afipia carboxidovorans]ACI91524.1 gentisate 1,2-dioxygenase [Afipia carboxidovorans OM5]AEI01310.1 hypothetical protein OCA4_c01520 [Afipia carboxidovorans OM4]AEI04884.1 hypothetical protein OCA5_c01520 [Afipia carboxidovorans OM5]BEV45655.1 hypothetical protein CRBSH125_18380 [Afipia carboxidovorans]